MAELTGAPIALVAYGSDNLSALRHSGLGFVVVGHNDQHEGPEASAACRRSLSNPRTWRR